MKYFRLEYNENKGLFRLAEKSNAENLNGWQTVARGMPEKRCMNFITCMEQKHKGLVDRRYKHPAFEVMYEEFYGKWK